MYALQMVKEESLLELTINENLNEDQLRVLLEDIRQARRKFSNGYRLLIIFPDKLRQANIDEREKIDLSIYTARMKGLKQVVLQTPEKNSPAVKRLQELYSGLSIPVSIAHDSIESQKILGLLWG